MHFALFDHGHYPVIKEHAPLCIWSEITGLSVCRNALTVPAGLPSHSGDVALYVLDINQPSLPTPFYSVLVSVSVFKAFSVVFHSINSPENSLLSHSVLAVSFLPCWSF